MTFAVSTPPSPSFAFVDQPFAEQALCCEVDPDPWYPEKGESNTVAKRVCAACPVTADCLDWAIATHERFGVWGRAHQGANGTPWNVHERRRRDGRNGLRHKERRHFRAGSVWENRDGPVPRY